MALMCAGVITPNGPVFAAKPSCEARDHEQSDAVTILCRGGIIILPA